MAAQYASMEEAEADAKEYIETTVKKAFDHLQPIEDTNEPYKAGDLVLCVQEGVWYPSSLVEQSSRSRNRIHVPIFKVHFDGWAPRWDEWVESDAGRLKRRTAENLAMARASLQEAEEEAAQERLEEVRQRFAKPVRPGIFFFGAITILLDPMVSCSQVPVSLWGRPT